MRTGISEEYRSLVGGGAERMRRQMTGRVRAASYKGGSCSHHFDNLLCRVVQRRLLYYTALWVNRIQKGCGITVIAFLEKSERQLRFLECGTPHFRFSVKSMPHSPQPFCYRGDYSQSGRAWVRIYVRIASPAAALKCRPSPLSKRGSRLLSAPLRACAVSR